jgi:hypothetical protein
MSAQSIEQPYPIFTDADGDPLENGYIWIGTENLYPITNPVAVYWDEALTQPAVQPIRTQGGYPVNAGTPARLYVSVRYSILVQDRNGITVYSSPSEAALPSSALVSFLQAGSGAVTRTAQSKMREWVSVKDFGAVGDGVADDTAAIQAAIASLPVQIGGIVYFPSSTGAYICNSTLTWDNKPVILLGAGNGVQPNAGVIIKFSAGVTGLNVLNGSTGYGANSGIENLHIVGSDTGAGTNDGVLIRCNGFKAVNCTVEKFGRHGWHVLSDISGSPSPIVSVNANGVLLMQCRGRNNYGDGLHTRGENSNIMTTINFDSSGNAGWGYFFDQILGGVHLCPHESGDNALGAFRFGPNGGRDRIFGGYKEASATIGVQIDSGNSGYINADFLEMTSSVTDNTPTKNNRITWTASADVVTNRLAIGDALGIYALFTAAGMLLDLGKVFTLKNASQNAIWNMNVLADQRLYIESAQAKDFLLGNNLAAPTATFTSAAITNTGGVTIGGTTASTVGAAGAASALPANPLGYIIGNVSGVQVKIPYYNT